MCTNIARTYHRILYLSLIFTCLQAVVSKSLHAQWLPFQNQNQSHFQRQLDAMRWQYGQRADYSRNGFELKLSNDFTSRLFLSEGKAQNIQDENELEVSLRQELSPKWALAATTHSYSFTTTRLRQQSGYFGAAYRPIELLEISLLGGLMSDRRSNNKDQGFSSWFRAGSRPLRAGDFSIQPYAEAQYAHISPREYSNYRFQTASEYELETFFMQGDFYWSSGRGESYQPSSFFNRGLTNIIESIRNDTTSVELGFRMPVTRSAALRIDLHTLNNIRTVESRPVGKDFEEAIFDTRTQRQEIHLVSVADYRPDNHHLSAGINFSYIHRGSRLINTRDLPEDQVTRRTEILRNSNFDQSRFELFTRNRFRLSGHHEVTLHAQSSILRYDTPQMNQDDRDEQAHLILIASSHRLSPFFDLHVRAGGEATHYVYLSASRSIENNWRRTIRLSPQIRWQPHHRITIRNTLLVRANYTVEDYQLEGRPKNDQSSREYTHRMDIDMLMAENWMLELNGSRNELRIGRLHWDTFQETPTDTVITYNFQAMTVFQKGAHRIGVGGRFFLRTDFLPQATISTEVLNDRGFFVPVSRTSTGSQITRQFGPSVDLRLHFASGNRLVISGWLQQQQVRRKLYTTYSEELAEVFRSEERRAIRRTYPNLEVRAIFTL